jgi:hypothetical protein
MAPANATRQPVVYIQKSSADCAPRSTRLVSAIWAVRDVQSNAQKVMGRSSRENLITAAGDL